MVGSLARRYRQRQAAAHLPLGRRCLGAWGAGGPHRKRPSSQTGRFCCADGLSRGRETDAEAGNRLSITDAGETIASGHPATLIDAFERRQQQVGGQAVMLDAVVEIGAEHGYPGGMWAARQLLDQGGEFVAETGPRGRPTVRRADSPVP